MPIFEYQCTQCKKEFEKLVFSDSEVNCPDCSSADVKKLLSIFGFKSGNGFSSSSSSGDCSGCAATSCSSCK